jgi:hypothetical protein
LNLAVKGAIRSGDINNPLHLLWARVIQLQQDALAFAKRLYHL